MLNGGGKKVIENGIKSLKSGMEITTTYDGTFHANPC